MQTVCSAWQGRWRCAFWRLLGQLRPYGNRVEPVRPSPVAEALSPARDELHCCAQAVQRSAARSGGFRPAISILPSWKHGARSPAIFQARLGVDRRERWWTTHISAPLRAAYAVVLVPQDHCDAQVGPDWTDAHVRVSGKFHLVQRH